MNEYSQQVSSLLCLIIHSVIMSLLLSTIVFPSPSRWYYPVKWQLLISTSTSSNLVSSQRWSLTWGMNWMSSFPPIHHSSKWSPLSSLLNIQPHSNQGKHWSPSSPPMHPSNLLPVRHQFITHNHGRLQDLLVKMMSRRLKMRCLQTTDLLSTSLQKNRGERALILPSSHSPPWPPWPPRPPALEPTLTRWGMAAHVSQHVRATQTSTVQRW